MIANMFSESDYMLRFYLHMMVTLPTVKSVQSNTIQTSLGNVQPSAITV